MNFSNPDFINSFEKIALDIHPSPQDASRSVALEIAELIKAKQANGEICVLGLATGSTPKKLYAELINLHQNEGLSFKNVVTFNLDEYYPIEPDATQSYVNFMKRNLFDHIDIDPRNCHIPDGTLPKDQIRAFCDLYEKKIKSFGGLDLQILGIGGNGHIGFNEPGSIANSQTRLITLDNRTRIDNAYEFDSISKVPRFAITMGIDTIMNAQKTILMAWGTHKASIIRETVEGNVRQEVPASFLQLHKNCKFVIDRTAASELTRFRTPWLTGACEWNDKMIRKAVVMLALQLKKPILMLTNNDYNDNGLSDLLALKNTAYSINIQVFNKMQHTITGFPGGKPNFDDATRPERAKPSVKRSLIFSPHPDDDIISMGGTFIRLHEQGNTVHVAYQTSGNIAVSDDFVLRYIDFAAGFEHIFGINKNKATEILKDAQTFLKTKSIYAKDTPQIRAIKALIRRTEATATCRFVGIDEKNIHFQNLPFYETGTVEKNPMGSQDIQQTVDLIKKIKPHQIFCAGDLADPHGTHKVCLDVVFEAINQLKNEAFMDDCWVWLYRGAWHEWAPYETQMAIPMSPDQVLQKRKGIFIHQSQKDDVMFQGDDTREFWQRAEQRNAQTAEVYNQLGLPQYAAIESFVRYHFK